MSMLNYSWEFSYMPLTLSFSHEYPRISTNYPLMAARSPFCLTNTDDTDQTDNKESGQSEQSVFKKYKDILVTYRRSREPVLFNEHG